MADFVGVPILVEEDGAEDCGDASPDDSSISDYEPAGDEEVPSTDSGSDAEPEELLQDRSYADEAAYLTGASTGECNAGSLSAGPM